MPLMEKLTPSSSQQHKTAIDDRLQASKESALNHEARKIVAQSHESQHDTPSHHVGGNVLGGRKDLKHAVMERQRGHVAEVVYTPQPGELTRRQVCVCHYAHDGGIADSILLAICYYLILFVFFCSFPLCLGVPRVVTEEVTYTPLSRYWRI
jgi:hypothetical protein